MDKEEIMRTAVEYNYHSDLDDICKRLQELNAQGKNVYIEFDGKKLYSLLDSVDDCYIKVTGETKADYERLLAEELRKFKEEELKEELTALEKMPARIERGKQTISPELHDQWENCVKIRTSDIYHGIELDDAIDIMEAIAANDFEKGYQLLEDAYQDINPYLMICSIIKTFSPKGKEFLDWVE